MPTTAPSGQVLARRRPWPDRGVEIRRLVLEEIAEVDGFLNGRHGLLLCGEFLDGRNDGARLGSHGGSGIGGDARGDLGLFSAGVQQGAADLDFAQAWRQGTRPCAAGCRRSGRSRRSPGLATGVRGRGPGGRDWHGAAEWVCGVGSDSRRGIGYCSGAGFSHGFSKRGHGVLRLE